MGLDVPFKVGEEVTYAAIQSAFRGQSGKGMSCSLETKSLVLITDAQEKKKATAIYQDSWDESGVLHYRGVGQHGDQNIDYEGNKWLSRSAEMGIGVYLFERVSPKNYRYYGEVVLAAAIAKKGDANETLAIYRTANGRTRIENLLIGQAELSIQREVSGGLSLLKYWRDEASHGESSSIGDNEAYTSLAMLLRFATSVSRHWEALVRPAQ